MAPTTRSHTKRSDFPNTRRLSSPCEPPVYRVDLSQPPKHRYDQICTDFKEKLAGIVPIYGQLLKATGHHNLLDFFARALLRRVHSSEETREIRGIARATGVPLHLVVAFNTFLDLFSGCSSGGVLVSDAGSGKTSGIVHFRGLDWEMEPLRQLIICIEYIRNDEVVARSVTYAGYVGVLTGVREGLSISLNYRIRLWSKSSLFSHRFHQFALLMGWRPSISSVLRHLLLSPGPAPSVATLAEILPKAPTTPCYLTFCSQANILILEKDLVTARLRTSASFLAVTNNDEHIEALSADAWRDIVAKAAPAQDAILADSIERKQCMMRLWKKRTVRQRQRITVADVVRQLEVQPVQNESTHFSCVMDPGVPGGGLLWVRAYPEPVEMEEGLE
uniref:ceramidase n=1 Tax=Mycena chlorophos TaxID=658473 RepID=A0ABQ0LZS8_MYCCL|nr:predicted protein [Mycena chlorophos]